MYVGTYIHTFVCMHASMPACTHVCPCAGQLFAIAPPRPPKEHKLRAISETLQNGFNFYWEAVLPVARGTCWLKAARQRRAGFAVKETQPLKKPRFLDPQSKTQ